MYQWISLWYADGESVLRDASWQWTCIVDTKLSTYRIDCLYVDNDCMYDHIEWAKFVNSIEYEEWISHVLFNIPMNMNLALKSLNGFVNWFPLIQKLLFVLYEYCYLLLNDDKNVSHYTWILIGIYCWCLNIKFIWIDWFFWLRQWRPHDYHHITC